MLKLWHLNRLQGEIALNSWQKEFAKWNTYENLEINLKESLAKIAENDHELEDAFYQELTFGTGGMRGVLGPGTNRMNIYTVRKAVNGLANHIKSKKEAIKKPSVVIAYDSRYMSQEFALEAAKVLGVHGVKTYVFRSLRPTPLLSFAVRHLKTTAGIMITASHNPSEYNGFKVYNEDGGQITLEEANEVIQAVQQSPEALHIDTLEQEELEEKGLLQWLDEEVDQAYLEQLKEISKLDKEHQEQQKDLQIVYTPLHGTGLGLVEKGLKQLHFSHLHIVEEQAIPDPEFSTVESPNPEEGQAFERAIQKGEKHDADILLATDPDADRLGVAVKNKGGKYELLTGNQLGALLLDYILAHTKEETLANGRMLQTIVTSELGRVIARSYGVKPIDTLTGFKFISEKIREYDQTGEAFLFGYEESYGYLIQSFARDKDAVQAAVMASEMAYYWKQKGKTLIDALELLYDQHGAHLEGITQLTLKGIEGNAQIQKIMTHFRNHPPVEIAGHQITQTEDYLSSERKIHDELKTIEKIKLPEENVLKFMLEDGAWTCLRPSGTEPKLKCYYGVCGKDKSDSKQQLNQLKQAMEKLMDQAMND